MRKRCSKILCQFIEVLDKFGLKTLFYYGVVGLLSASINVLTFALFWDVLHIYYKIAVTLSYFLSVLFNFISNRSLTFKDAKGSLAGHMCKYLTMIGINYLITLFLVHYVVETLKLTPYIGLISAIVITAFIGFALSKFWVFPSSRERSHQLVNETITN